MYKLSILILSVSDRLDKLQRLLAALKPQSVGKSVQILWLGDNESMTVGEKRNRLRQQAAGKYIAFIDDDDLVSESYISELLKAIESNPDCIGFKVRKFTDGIEDNRHQHFSDRYQRITLAKTLDKYWLPPNHLCAWRRELALSIEYPHKNLAEDMQWAEKMALKPKSFVFIDKFLYDYLYSTTESKTHPKYGRK